MTQVKSFPPLLGSSANALIVGSMPGAASLAANQYYAHPRNAFWPIMGELFGADPNFDYQRRVVRLTQAHIAVWDVIGACVRPGSLDADIQHEGMVVNDFRGLLDRHPEICRVYFNGAKAEQLFEKMVLPTLANGDVFRRRLPSTSPANASMKFQKKLAAWRCIVDDSALPRNAGRS